MYFEDDIIAARATPPGESAIAVIRMTGNGCLNILTDCMPGFNGDLQPRRATLAQLGDDAGIIDQVIAIFYPTPNSYSGEDMVEVHCHGGGYISRRILSLFYEHGARPAGPGEFTFRAFLNGKMDLTQAEAVLDIIAAESESARKNALRQLYGGFSKLVRKLREELLDILAEVEAEIEFPEDESLELDYSNWSDRINGLINSIKAVIDLGRCGRSVREGFRVTIAGPPNSGKSTLLNALLGEERAIVHHSAGTTRDILREAVEIDGVRIILTDTAGLRSNAEEIESEGINRAKREIETADMVILLYDLSLGFNGEQYISELSRNAVVIAGNKVDLYPDVRDECDIKISALRGDGLEQLKIMIAEKAQCSRIEEGVIANERHLELLQRSHECLLVAVKLTASEGETELIALELREAAGALGNITGEGVTEEVLEKIFSRFCIGK